MSLIELFSEPQAWISLATLAALEIVLGIDNIVFISIVAAKLPRERRSFARKMGLGLALGTRLILLFSLAWVMGLTAPMFTIFDHGVSGRDLILLLGGLFLIGKATVEIHDKVEGAPHEAHSGEGTGATMASVLIQIMLLDVVFSLDSVITAVGMVDEIAIMVIAVVLAMIVMILFANPVGDFVENHPSIKILALSFLVLIGVMLTAEGTGSHIDKGYIYFAMAFSLTIELLNLRFRARRQKFGGVTGAPPAANA